MFEVCSLYRFMIIMMHPPIYLYIDKFIQNSVVTTYMLELIEAAVNGNTFYLLFSLCLSFITFSNLFLRYVIHKQRKNFA